MPFTFEMYKTMIATGNVPAYFRTRSRPPLVKTSSLSNQECVLNQAMDPMYNYDSNMPKPEFLHHILQFVDGILPDLAPGQYCRSCHNTIVSSHREFSNVLQDFVDEIRKNPNVTDQAVEASFHHLKKMQLTARKALLIRLMSALCNCHCYPDLNIIYSDGKDVTITVDQMYADHHGQFLSSRPISFRHFVQTGLDDYYVQATGDVVDGPFGNRITRAPPLIIDAWRSSKVNLFPWVESDEYGFDVPDAVEIVQQSGELPVYGECEISDDVFECEDADSDEDFYIVLSDGRKVGLEEFKAWEKSEEFSSLTTEPDVVPDTQIIEDSVHDQILKQTTKDMKDLIKLFVSPQFDPFAPNISYPDVNSHECEDFEDDLQDSLECNCAVCSPIDVIQQAGSPLVADYGRSKATDTSASTKTIKICKTSKMTVCDQQYEVHHLGTNVQYDTNLAIAPSTGMPSEFPFQVVDTLTFDNAATGTDYIRLRVSSHTAFSLISRLFSYFFCNFVVKLSCRPCLGVAAQFKIGLLDANTKQDTTPTITRAEILSGNGPVWNVNEKSEIYVMVPWTRADLMLTHDDIMSVIGITPIAPTAAATGVTTSIQITVEVAPIDIRYFAKRAPAPLVSVRNIPFNTNLTLGPGTFYVSSATLQSGALHVIKVETASGTLVGNLISDETISSVILNEKTTVKVSALPGIINNSVIFVSNPITDVNVQATEIVQQSGKFEQGGVDDTVAPFEQSHIVDKNLPLGTDQVNVSAEEKIYVPILTTSVTNTVTTSPFLQVKMSPRNFGLTGNTGTYTPSHASLEAERFCFYGPANHSFVTIKLTSIANAYANGRIYVAAIPAGVAVPNSVKEATQFPGVYHNFHGGESQMSVPWLHPLPALATSSDLFPCTLAFYLLESSYAASQGTPQLTLWVSADNMNYSVPRAPLNFTVLA
nr:structural polyprotein [Biomphalaria virus 1]